MDPPFHGAGTADLEACARGRQCARGAPFRRSRVADHEIDLGRRLDRGRAARREIRGCGRTVERGRSTAELPDRHLAIAGPSDQRPPAEHDDAGFALVERYLETRTPW